MDAIRKLTEEKFQLKSATKLMEDLDVLEETKGTVWNIIRNDIRNVMEFEALSDGDECDIVLINMENRGIAVITVEGGYGMFQPAYIPLIGRAMKATLDKEGMLHVFAVRNDRLWHVQEKAPHSRLFTSPEEVTFIHPIGFNGIEKLLLHRSAENESFVLGVVSKVGNSSYWVSWRQWEASLSFNLIQSSFSSPMLAFSGMNVNELGVECLSDTYTSYSVAQRKNRFSYRLELPEGDKVWQLYAYGPTVFALLKSDSGNVPVEIRMDGKEEKAIVAELVPRGSYHAMSMYTDAEGRPYMALSGDRLNYLRLKKTEHGYVCMEIMPLDKSCTFLSFNGNAECQRIFYFLEDNKIHVLENQKDVTWVENVLDLPEEGEVRRIPCYSTEMTFLRPDNHLVPLTDAEITLWAESRTYIETSVGIVKLDTDIQTILHTDINGKITFKQYCNGLDVPVVYASLSSKYMAVDEAVAISQFSDIHERLSNITAQQLLDAQQADSMSGVVTPFLPDEHRNEETVSQLASGIQDIMKITPQGNGLYMMKKAQLCNISRIIPRDGLPSWSLDFSGEKLRYKRLSDADADREINLMKERVNGNANGFFSKIADFFRSVIKGIVSVVKIIVKGIKAVVEFVLDGVKMVFEAIISVVQEVFHFVEMVFAAILIFFVTVFAWLASLFMWNDVIRMKRAIKESFMAIMESLPDRLNEAKSIFQEQMELMGEEIDSYFDSFMAQLGAKETFCSYTENNVPKEDPEMEYELSNNPLISNFNANILQKSCMSTGTLQLTAKQMDVFEEFFDMLKSLVEKFGDNQYFKEAMFYFNDVMSNLDKFLSSVLCGILSVIKGVIHLVLDGAITLVSAAMDMFRSILSTAVQMMDTEIKVPFFSSLYRSMTGDSLTIMNFVSFLSSLPAVLTHKLLYKTPPFKNDEEIDTFIETIRSSLSVSTDLRTVSKEHQRIVKICSAEFACFLGITNSLLSFTSQSSKNTPSFDFIFSGIALFLEVGWMFCCVPWIFEKKPTLYTIAAWSWFAFGASVDLIITCSSGKYVDKERTGQLFLFFYGLVHMLIAICGILCKKAQKDETELSIVGGVGEIIGSITEASKIMFLQPGETKKHVIGTIDLIGSISIPICIAKG